MTNRYSRELRLGLCEARRENWPKKRKQIRLLYHQREVAGRLPADAAGHGSGKRRLIQDSAGRRRSSSIVWLANQPISLERKVATVFDSIVVVTGRPINNTVRQSCRIGRTACHAERSVDLSRFIELDKKIIISIAQKCALILAEIGDAPRGRKIAIIIDEARFGYGGSACAPTCRGLSESGAEAQNGACPMRPR
ncbi:MAG: hypothetical protein OXI01_19590 [Albidovulum sp.]|nr:hypothetical protein [Albidovulum sp.]